MEDKKKAVLGLLAIGTIFVVIAYCVTYYYRNIDDAVILKDFLKLGTGILRVCLWIGPVIAGASLVAIIPIIAYLKIRYGGKIIRYIKPCTVDRFKIIVDYDKELNSEEENFPKELCQIRKSGKEEVEIVIFSILFIGKSDILKRFQGCRDFMFKVYGLRPTILKEAEFLEAYFKKSDSRKPENGVRDIMSIGTVYRSQTDCSEYSVFTILKSGKPFEKRGPIKYFACVKKSEKRD